jgi:hypothetical protein
MSKFTFDLNSLKEIGQPLSGQVASLERGLSANTPDDKLTYSGNDPIVWDRVNNERLQRGLSPLPGPRPTDDGRTFGNGRGSTTLPGNTSKTFEVNGPPGMTREQAFELFKKQANTGGLDGFNPGDILSAQTQAADGLASAQAELQQSFAGFPGTDKGVQNQFASIAESAKQSIAAGNTGSLQSRITNGGGILQQTGAKVGSLFGTPVTNGITTSDFAKTATALVPMAGLSTTDVRATMASVGASTGQDFSQVTNSVGCGKYGFDATQLESAGLLKPGTASSFLSNNNNTLTDVLKSPAVWTGKGGINNLDSLLSNPAAQNLTQQNLMSNGLAVAGSLGVPINSLKPKDLGGVAANFSKSGAAGADWIKGQLPADKQADFDQKWKDAQFAVGSADEKFNDAMLQQAPPGEATDTVNRETLTAALGRVFGNDKIPPVNYDGPPQPPAPLFAEYKRLITLSKEQQTKLADLASKEATPANANALIAQYDAIRKYLDQVAKDLEILKQDLLKQNFTYEITAEVDAELATVLAIISDIRTLFVPNLRRIR